MGLAAFTRWRCACAWQKSGVEPVLWGRDLGLYVPLGLTDPETGSGKTLFVRVPFDPDFRCDLFGARWDFIDWGTYEKHSGDSREAFGFDF